MDHRGFRVLVPRQFPNRPDIAAAFQRMRAEGMPERVASGAFGRSGLARRAANAQRLAQPIEQFRLAPFQGKSARSPRGNHSRNTYGRSGVLSSRKPTNPADSPIPIHPPTFPIRKYAPRPFPPLRRIPRRHRKHVHPQRRLRRPESGPRHLPTVPPNIRRPIVPARRVFPIHPEQPDRIPLEFMANTTTPIRPRGSRQSPPTTPADPSPPVVVNSRLTSCTPRRAASKAATSPFEVRAIQSVRIQPSPPAWPCCFTPGTSAWTTGCPVAAVSDHRVMGS